MAATTEENEALEAGCGRNIKVSVNIVETRA
jgi:hypothetical protein